MLLMLSFKPLGLISTIPTAHTFFGTFCWGIRLLYGEGKLKDFLQSYTNNPPIIFSSVIFEKEQKLYFPKPACMGLFVKLEELDENPLNAYRKHKGLKSAKLVSEEVLKDFLEGKKVELQHIIQENKQKEEYYYEKTIIPHASINRLTSTTMGGELFFETAYAISTFRILIRINHWSFEDKPEELLPAVFNLLPIGGGKSTGRGLFEVKVEKLPEWLLEFTNEGEYFYSLSEFMYDTNLDLENSYYEVEVKRPAVENYFGKVGLLWKNPMLFIKPGAVMKVKSKAQNYGTLKRLTQDLYHYAYAFPLYFRGEPPC